MTATSMMASPITKRPTLTPSVLKKKVAPQNTRTKGDDVGSEPEHVLERIRYGDREHGVAGHDDGDEQRDADDGKRDADEVRASTRPRSPCAEPALWLEGPESFRRPSWLRWKMTSSCPGWMLRFRAHCYLRLLCAVLYRI